MSDKAEAAPKKMSGTTKLLLGLFIGFPLLLFVGCSALLISGSGHGSRAPSDVEARNQCQDWVRDKLKAPSTADFADTITVAGSPAWKFTGQVDAENSFGAKIRTGWSCTISLDGDTWRGSAVLN